MIQPTGYADPTYAEVESGQGTSLRLPASGGALLVRKVPGTGLRDARAPYPFLVCADWRKTENVEHGDTRLCRMFVARREGPLSVYDIHYLVGTPAGVEHFVEREELGLFTHEDYMGALRKAGLEAFHDLRGGLFDDHNIGMYWGVRRP